MVEPATLQHLVPLINRRFQSFAEATDVALGALAAPVPGTIIVAQVEADEGLCRVLDARGEGGPGIERGAVLPLAKRTHGNGNGADPSAALTPGADWLEPAFLRPLGFATSLSLPVELSEGNVVGLVCAISPEEGVYQREHAVLLGFVARILSYEWERVRIRAELRQLRQRVQDGRQADPETGLPNRAGFSELLDREWRLAKRGTVHSMVVACEVRIEDRPALGAAMGRLALKDAAEVLAAAVRSTDHIGRLDTTTLGVVMIGCDQPAGVEALIGRYTEALQRTTRGRPFEITLSTGAQSLAWTDSSEQALELAEREAREGARVEEGQPR